MGRRGQHCYIRRAAAHAAESQADFFYYYFFPPMAANGTWIFPALMGLMVFTLLLGLTMLHH